MYVINHFPVIAYLGIIFFAWELYKLYNWSFFLKLMLYLRYLRRRGIDDLPLDQKCGIIKMIFPMSLVELTYIIWTLACIGYGYAYWPFAITGIGLLLVSIIHSRIKRRKVLVIFNPLDNVLSMLLISCPFWI